MGILIELYISPAPLRISKIISKSAQIATPGSQYLALERRNGPNPSDRSIGMPMGAHKTATEDKCDSSWAYLSSYIYPHPLPEARKSRNLPRSRPPGTNTLPFSDNMGQIPATEALGCRWGAIRRLRKTSVIVVGHTCRVIYITSLDKILKKLEICPERPPGANTLSLSDNYQIKTWSTR